MIITISWLKEHLITKAKESEIIDQLTNIGLEVEGVKENYGKMEAFRIAKITFSNFFFFIFKFNNTITFI